jgi:probable F420-dependent oxidoreductase
MSRQAGEKPIHVCALGDSMEEIAEGARAAEAAGMGGVFAIELFRGSLTQAMWLAASTQRIGVATGIAWAFTRSPLNLALDAMDVDEASGGRFTLGLGAGVKRLNETWHGAEYGRPAPHLRETVEAVRMIVERAGTGEPIRYEGRYHDLDIRGWARPAKPVRTRIPIHTAGVQEGMARMAGDVADGLLGHVICSVRWIDEVLVPSFELGLRRSGRSRSDFEFIPGLCAAIDDDEGAALDAARRTVAFYATVRTYAPLWELHGFGGEAEAARAAFRAGDLPGVLAAVTDEMVRTYCAAGPADAVRERVAEVAERGDAVAVMPPTYFLEGERVREYQRRILATFGDGARA